MMNDLNVIDRFLADFSRYIDSGFGLLGPDVGFLTSVLIAIDITLAGLFWAMGGETDVLGKLLRKILYVGVFAFILNNFSRLAEIIFRSFTQAGLTAAGGTMTADQLLQPGRLAGAGFSAAWPLLDQATELLGFTSFFSNFMTIMVLLIAWAITIVAFFVLAVQVFITILEFKLTTLAGFVLVPFALWNRTSFLAERTLGSVVSSGIKVMVLAVIIGIGSGYFTEFSEAVTGTEPDLGQAMSLVLASLTLLGLGIFGPSVASGLSLARPSSVQAQRSAPLPRWPAAQCLAAAPWPAPPGWLPAAGWARSGREPPWGVLPRPHTSSARKPRARRVSAPGFPASAPLPPVPCASVPERLWAWVRPRSAGATLPGMLARSALGRRNRAPKGKAGPCPAGRGICAPSKPPATTATWRSRQ